MDPVTAPDPQTPRRREVVLPGDPPAGGVRTWTPVLLAAAGVALAILGTLPEALWSWTGWRPSPSTWVFAHGTFLVVLTAATLAAMAITILVLWFGRRGRPEPAKKRAEVDPTLKDQLLLFALAAIVFGLIVAFLFLHGIDLDLDLRIWQSNTPMDELAATEEIEGQKSGFFAEMAPELPEWILGILQALYFAGLALTALAALVIGGIRARDLLRQGRSGGRRPDEVADDVAKATADSLEELELGGDPRIAIIRCYARFERSLAAAETPRAPWQTPMEFMRAVLSSLPLDPDDVVRLTRLFELARFSHHPLGVAEQAAALGALTAIRDTLAKRAPDA